MNKVLNRNKITHVSMGTDEMFWAPKWSSRSGEIQPQRTCLTSCRVRISPVSSMSTVDSKIIRALEIVRAIKLLSNTVL